MTGVAFGVIDPVPVPDIFRDPVNSYGAGFSSVQTQLSASLAVVTPLITAYVFGNRKFEREWVRIVWLLSFVPLAVAFIGSEGRSGILGAVVGTAVVIYLLNKKLFVGVVAASFAALTGVAVMATDSFFAFTQLNRGLDGFTSGRLSTFAKGLELAVANPLQGLGYGNLPFGIDNLYLVVAVQSGLFAALFVLVFVVTAWLRSAQILKYLSGTRYQTTAIGLFGAVTTYIPITLFERGVIFINFYLNVGWWICLGSLLMLPYLEDDTL
jgi:O-antigen ligase